MNIQDIKPGRQYGWQLETVAKMNKGGRAGVAPNPLNDAIVVKKASYAGQAASGEMYVNAMVAAKAAAGETYVPQDAKGFIPTSHPCIVESNTGGYQVRILRPRTLSKSYTVNGRPATAQELDIIRQYTPTRTAKPGTVKVMFPYVDSVQNLDMDGAENVGLESDED